MTTQIPTARRHARQDTAAHDGPQVWRPTSTCVLIQIRGELDAPGCAPLHELLATRLSSTVETLVLDLSEVSFIGVPALELLSHTQRRASSRGISLRLITGPRCVDRALAAARMSETFTCYPRPEQALAGLSGDERELATAR